MTAAIRKVESKEIGHYSALVQWLEHYTVTVEITSSILVCTAKIQPCSQLLHGGR